MIYLLAAVVLLTVARLAHVARRRGALFVLGGLAAAAAFGLVAGLLIGVGARVGMSAITFANGEWPSPTLGGTLSVVFTFAALGLPLGVVYEGLFRSWLGRGKALTYGALLTLCTWYPSAHAAAQQLTERPSFVWLASVSFVLVALMWLPYALALEALLARWQSWRAARALLAAGNPA
ncbi:MAG TPA: hypothetical protein VFX96_16855 [Pyrinomonadaceae bacterium]|nr:hypothetical protein [Pyrinomonadaceae bacterium]